MPADPDRQPFYCPYPGCKRKFASLWRLKVHYRAPPNERGSGKERGHGVELPICPACGEELEPGKHHNKCKAGRTTNPPSKRIPKSTTPTTRNAKQRKTTHEPARRKAPPPEEEEVVQDEPSSSSFPVPDMPLFAPHNNSNVLTAGQGDAAQDTQGYQGQFVVPSLFACQPPSTSGSSTQQPTVGFPAFDFGFFHPAGTGPQHVGHTVFQSVGPMHEGHQGGEPSGRGGDGSPHAAHIKPDFDGLHASGTLTASQRDPSLSAQAAAEVLYGIGRSEHDGGDDGGGGDGNNTPHLAFPHPAFMVPMPMAVGPNGMHVIAIPDGEMPGAHDREGMAHAAAGGQGGGSPRAAGLPNPQPLDVHMDGKALGHVHGTPVTAEGVPVDGFSSGMPVMMPWAPMQGMGGGQMMMMAPEGLMGVMGSSASGCPILVPLGLLSGKPDESLDGSVPMQVVGSIPMPHFGEGGIKLEFPGGMLSHMIAMNPDGTPHFVPAPQLGDIMSLPHVQMIPFQRPSETNEPAMCGQGVAEPSHALEGGVTDEDWRNAVKSIRNQFQETAEVSATS